MERLFKTLQDRRPKEFALAGVRTIEQANRFLRRRYLPAHNRRFSVAPAEAGSAFVPWIGSNLWDILCVQEERVVGNDNTVRYHNRLLQIPEDAHRRHYVKAKVRVHEYPIGKAQLRLTKRFARLRARGVQINKVCVAVALSGLLRGPEPSFRRAKLSRFRSIRSIEPCKTVTVQATCPFPSRRSRLIARRRDRARASRSARSCRRASGFPKCQTLGSM